MGVVEDQCCDGCGGRFSVDDLHVVSINGEEVVCCGDCRRHAERAAERSLAVCEGCGSTVAGADLEPIELPDGAEIACCEDCREQAPDGSSNGTAGAAGSASTRGTERHRERNGDHGSTAEASDASGPSAASGSSDSSPGQRARASGDGDLGSDASADEGHGTSKPARTENVCDQCGDSFTIELYRVVTVDDRTEEFCPECKREGVEEGIVRDVQLRRAQAFEVLGLTSAADEDSIREAYLRRVKEVHPDREDGSRSEFMMVKRAYERLTDEGS